MKDQWKWNQTFGDECEEKLELSVRTKPTAPLSNATTDTARQDTAGHHDDKRRRVDEPEAPISPVAQNEAPVWNPVSFDSESREFGSQKKHFLQSRLVHDKYGSKEVKMSQLTTAERREFLKSMDTSGRPCSRIKPPRCYLWKRRLRLQSVGRIVRWILVGLVFGSQSQGTTHHKKLHTS